jgi:hypothetical protein
VREARVGLPIGGAQGGRGTVGGLLGSGAAAALQLAALGRPSLTGPRRGMGIQLFV